MKAKQNQQSQPSGRTPDLVDSNKCIIHTNFKNIEVTVLKNTICKFSLYEILISRVYSPNSHKYYTCIRASFLTFSTNV